MKTSCITQTFGWRRVFLIMREYKLKSFILKICSFESLLKVKLKCYY